MTVVENAPQTQEIGQSRLRKEDRRLITGRTRWTDNIQITGLLHMAMVRSPIAHGNITGIDTSAAKQVPGVVAVFTGADLDAEQSSLPIAWPINSEQQPPKHPSIAVDKVTFAGEIVAIVVARSAATAKDAVELVEVDYDPLDPVLDMEAALRDDAPLVHPDLGSNKWAYFKLDSAEAGTGGDVDQAIAAADKADDQIVVRRRFRQQRLIPAFMEPRSVVVDPNAEQLTMWSATQVPHIVRTMTALLLGIPEHKLRVIAPDVGGGFGGKLQVIPEEWLAVLGFRQAVGAEYTHCWTEYYINRSYAAVGRMLQRHSGPIFPLIEDLFGVSVVEVYQEIGAVLVTPAHAERLKVPAGSAAVEVHRTYKTSDGEIAQVTINTHPGSRFRHSMTLRRVKGEA